MKNVLIIAHFCDYGKENSNNRFNYLANLLVDCGYHVELVTSSFSHRDKRQREKIENSTNYDINLVYEPSYAKNISIKRLFYSHKLFSNNLKKYLNSKDCKPDFIYCAIPSYDSCYVAMQYSKNNNVPFIIDIQDLWPDAYKLIIKNDTLYNVLTQPLKKKVDNIYRAADAIVSVSDTYLARALQVNTKARKKEVVFLGTNFSEFDTHKMETTADPYVRICYCGTLGKSYDLSVIIDALSLLINKGMKEIKLVVVGSGPSEKKTREHAKIIKDHIEFMGKKPYFEMVEILSECDIAVNPIKTGAAQSIINKHADYCAAGLPIISTQNCLEYENLLKEYNCGITCNGEDVNEVAKAIEYLVLHSDVRKNMGKNARKLGEDMFNREKTYLKIVDMIASL